MFVTVKSMDNLLPNPSHLTMLPEIMDTPEIMLYQLFRTRQPIAQHCSVSGFFATSFLFYYYFQTG